MAEIRSITYFCDVFADDHEWPVGQAGAFLTAAAAAFTWAGVRVQSKRLATQPFPRGFAPRGAGSLGVAAQGFSELCRAQGIDYVSIGPVRAEDNAAYVRALEDVFAATDNLFATVEIAERQNGIQAAQILNAAALIDRVSRLSADGMKNLFLAMIANCRPFSPFFPVAYHGGGAPAFALAIQGADLAQTAFAGAKNPNEAMQNLTAAIEAFAAPLVGLAVNLAAEHGVAFKGLDFSLAPYPTPAQSLGGALEALGPAFGGQGLVAAAALIMNAIEAANFPSVGFSGLMLPILEDSVLAQRAEAGRLSLNDLLLLSAICGTGLDCIPLAGDVGAEVLYSILLDVAALALRLDKPLTARLMPFPNKQAGDTLNFDFEYFSPSRVLPTPAYAIPSGSVLGAAATAPWRIQPR